MYHKLAHYYDALLKDEDAVQWWTDFFKKHHYGNSVLELASGTGEISMAIAQSFQLDATDLSEDMLNEIRLKDTDHLIHDIYKLDMLELSDDKKFDNIICFCDSINYILEESDLQKVFSKVYSALNEEGVFMFDMHTEDRLEEFKEPFMEVGNVLGTDFQWTITSEAPYIYHHFVFYEDSHVQEHHVQRVFTLETVIKHLEDLNFKLKLYTDFDQEGIHEGEKIFIVAQK